MDDVVQPGSVLAGKYRVERVLGQGGMGVVVAATHLQLGQLFALKFLLPQMFEHPEAVARFAREARAAVQIQSEHVARVTDVGTLESGAPYMVMEYLEGADLAEVLRARGPLPIAEAVGFLLQACEAVAEAHALGIVHRDLKPANLFLARRRDGSELVKVLDFGISKAMETLASPSVTVTSAVMGSPVYMSPEQVRSSKAVDARSDVWTLGVILQELLTGVPPYEAETSSALLAAIMVDPPTPLRQRRPDAPAQLELTILQCLEKDRERRMPDVVELARALAPFGDAEARASLDRISRVLGKGPASQSWLTTSYEPGGPVMPGSGTNDAWGQTQTRTRGGRSIAFAVVALLFGAGLFVAGLAWWRSQPERLPPAPTEPHVAATPSPTTEAAPLTVKSADPPLPNAGSVVPADPGLPLVVDARVPEEPRSEPVKAQAPPLVLKKRPARARPPGAAPDLFDDNK